MTASAPSDKAQKATTVARNELASVRAPKPAAGSPRADAASTLRLLETYQRRYLGIDMVLKTLCYGMRLYALYEPDPKRRATLDTLILNIVDCRMLCNSMKHFGTATLAHAALEKALLADVGARMVVGLLTFGSYFFRTFEQTYGDLGYLQKNWFSQWSRDELSRRYKMFKCFSLVCSALLELNKLRPFLVAKSRKLVEAARQTEGHVRWRIRRFSTAALDEMEQQREKRISRELDETASIAASPATLSPRTGTSPGDSTTHVSAFATHEPLTPATPAVARSTSLVALTRRPDVRSSLFLLRNIADLIVYSTWIESYKPSKVLVNACGVVSGALGVLLVWYDTKADALGVPMLQQA